jgi:hypothetical protein
LATSEGTTTNLAAEPVSSAPRSGCRGLGYLLRSSRETMIWVGSRNLLHIILSCESLCGGGLALATGNCLEMPATRRQATRPFSRLSTFTRGSGVSDRRRKPCCLAGGMGASAASCLACLKSSFATQDATHQAAQHWWQVFQQRHYWRVDIGSVILIGLGTTRFRSNVYSSHEVTDVLVTGIVAHAFGWRLSNATEQHDFVLALLRSTWMKPNCSGFRSSW